MVHHHHHHLTITAADLIAMAGFGASGTLFPSYAGTFQGGW